MMRDERMHAKGAIGGAGLARLSKKGREDEIAQVKAQAAYYGRNCYPEAKAECEKRIKELEAMK